MAAPISSSYQAETQGGARGWFEWIEREAGEVERDRARLSDMESRIALSGAGIGGTGGGVGGDFTDMAAAMADLKEAMDRREARLGAATAAALRELFGLGGLAQDDPTAADCIDAHYLERRTWADVAEGMRPVGRKPDERWCRYRAARGFAELDRRGFAARMASFQQWPDLPFAF